MTKRTREAKTELLVLVGSGIVTVILLAISALTFMGTQVPELALDQHQWVDVFCFALLAALGPYGFYRHRVAKRIRNLEERFPDFLRDLAASKQAGLTLDNAVRIAADGEYGALTPDIQKMADQISWNVPFEEALMRLSERVNTPLVERACTLINEASRSGAHVTDVLEAAAVDARELKTLETSRRMTMGLYTVVIYIAFLVFLGVAAVLYGSFIPEVLGTTQGATGTGLSQGGASDGVTGTFETGGITLVDFRTFFFLAVVAQGVGNGVLSGVMETGKPLAGLRHAFVMVLASYLVFGLLL